MSRGIESEACITASLGTGVRVSRLKRKSWARRSTAKPCLVLVGIPTSRKCVDACGYCGKGSSRRREHDTVHVYGEREAVHRDRVRRGKERGARVEERTWRSRCGRVAAFLDCWQETVLGPPRRGTSHSRLSRRCGDARHHLTGVAKKLCARHAGRVARLATRIPRSA